MVKRHPVALMIFFLALSNLSAQTPEESAALQALSEGNPAPALRLVRAGHPGYVNMAEPFDPVKSFLTAAIRSNNLSAARTFLEAGVPFNRESNFGVTYDLMVAVVNRNPAMVRLLLEFGANPNEFFANISRSDVIDATILTPLTTAASLGEREIIRVLLHAKADPQIPSLMYYDHQDGNGVFFLYQTALDHAANTQVKEFLRQAGGRSIEEQSLFGVPATVKDHGLRLRAEPGLRGEVVRTLSAGTNVLALRTTEEGETIGNKTARWWFVVLPDGVKGWVYGAFLDFDPYILSNFLE